jgi:hypothetical protein
MLVIKRAGRNQVEILEILNHPVLFIYPPLSPK